MTLDQAGFFRLLGEVFPSIVNCLDKPERLLYVFRVNSDSEVYCVASAPREQIDNLLDIANFTTSVDRPCVMGTYIDLIQGKGSFIKCKD